MSIRHKSSASLVPACHNRAPFMVLQDLTFALRMLRKAPGFTAAAVLATALGIGANTAIFTVVKQVLLQPLPFPDPSRIVDVNEYARGATSAVSPPNFMDWRAQNRSLTAIGAYTSQVLTLSGAAEPARISGGFVDDRVFDVLAIAPIAGRAFNPQDVIPEGRKVVILGYDIWQRAYGGDR